MEEQANHPPLLADIDGDLAELDRSADVMKIFLGMTPRDHNCKAPFDSVFFLRHDCMKSVTALLKAFLTQFLEWDTFRRRIRFGSTF